MKRERDQLPNTPPSRSYEEQLHYMGRQAQMLAEEGNDVSSDVMAECARAYAAEHKRAEEATLQLGYMKAGVYQQQAKGWETITRLLDEISPGWSTSLVEFDGKTGIERATAAIKRLSARSESGDRSHPDVRELYDELQRRDENLVTRVLNLRSRLDKLEGK